MRGGERSDQMMIAWPPSESHALMLRDPRTPWRQAVQRRSNADEGWWALGRYRRLRRTSERST